jgi:hypothetical protein
VTTIPGLWIPALHAEMTVTRRLVCNGTGLEVAGTDKNGAVLFIGFILYELSGCVLDRYSVLGYGSHGLFGRGAKLFPKDFHRDPAQNAFLIDLRGDRGHLG